MTGDHVHKDLLKDLKDLLLIVFSKIFSWVLLGFFGSGTEDIGGSVLWTQRRWGCTRHPYASSRAKGDGGNIPPPLGPEIPGVHGRFSSSRRIRVGEKACMKKHVAMEMRSQKKMIVKKITGNVIGLHDDINQTNKGAPLN